LQASRAAGASAERVKALLADYHPEYIDPKADAKIRANFPLGEHVLSRYDAW
jgi:hypothetical protein